MSKGASIAGLFIVSVLPIMLVGCNSADGFPILDRAQTEEDQLPRSVRDDLGSEDFDLDSARLSASKDGIDYFLVEGGDSPVQGEPCLVIVDGASASSVCGGMPVGFEPEKGDAVQLMPAPAVEGDGWTVLSDNIRVRAVK